MHYPFIEYLCIVTGCSGIGEVRKYFVPPYYCGDVEISIIDDNGKVHDLIANIFVNTGMVRNLPSVLQDRKYIGIIANTIMAERDSIDVLDRCEKCGSFDQIVKYGYPFHKRGIKSKKDTGRYGECRKCKTPHHLSPFIAMR